MKHPATCSMRIVVAALAGVAPALLAEPAPVMPGADHRVAARLEAAQQPYAVDEDGDFRILYARAGGRTQVAWIASATNSVGGLELRDLWSVAMRGQGEPPAALLARLLQQNAARAFGAWQLQRSGEEYLVVLSATAPADADATTLMRLVESLVADADEWELTLTGKDEF